MYGSLETISSFVAPVTNHAAAWLGDSWDETPGFVLFFALLFIASLGFWSLVYRLPMQKASLLSSCVMSSVHGTIVSVVGFKLLREWKSFDLDIENTREQVGRNILRSRTKIRSWTPCLVCLYVQALAT